MLTTATTATPALIPGFEPAQSPPTLALEVVSLLLERSAAMHDHLCPRQVLGVRMGLLAREWLDVDETWHHKRLFVFVETDGCFADGVSVATNCWLGHRTMRLVDQGKVAATFVDTDTGRSVRIVPHPLSRLRAEVYALDAPGRWHAQRDGYQMMPTDELLRARWVALAVNIRDIISEPKGRSVCAGCGEEIINHREIVMNGLPCCRSCAGLDGYFNDLDREAKRAAVDSHPSGSEAPDSPGVAS